MAENPILCNINSGIIFIYFDDFADSCERLEKQFGFLPRIHYGYACLFEAHERFFIGAVDRKAIGRQEEKDKSCMLCFTASNLEELHTWHHHLVAQGVQVTEVKKSARLPYYNFRAEGPEGYAFELGHFCESVEFNLFNPDRHRRDEKS